MYKEWIICTIVVFLIITGNIITQTHTEESVQDINKQLEDLKEDLKKEEVDKEKVEAEINNIVNEWQEKYKKLAYYIEHDELEKVETELTSLKSNIEIEQYDEGIPELDKSIFILNHIKEKFKFDIKNIF